MKEKVLFEGWFKTLDHQERPIHVIIVEDQYAIKVYENEILHLRKIKKGIKNE